MSSVNHVRIAVSFSGLKEQIINIKDEIESSINRVLESGWYILGQEVEAFEKEFADYCGVRYAVGCASGTEAIALALMALRVNAGDEVITVPHTAVPTVTGISMVDASPVFVDVNDDYLMDVDKIEYAVTGKTKVLMPVHLYGQMVEMDVVVDIAQKYDLYVIEDACQAHGAEFRNKRAGAWGDLGCFSFYPTKNLGCYGDGGAVTTNNRDLYDTLTMLRNYGQESRYHHTAFGINSRLDEIQAAVLRVKLKYLDRWNEKRRALANCYTEALKNICNCPKEMPNRRHVYHLYVIRYAERDKLAISLKAAGIETLIHYPIPVHLQKAYAHLNYNEGDFPNTENIAKEILSLPIYPEVTHGDINIVCKHIIKFRENR